MSEREVIFLGVPSIGNAITLELHAFISECLLSNRRDDIPYRFKFGTMRSCAPVEYARNYLVRRALEEKADRLWMIDDDMLPKPEAISLLDVDADIVVPSMFVFFEGNPGLRVPAEFKLCAFERNGTEEYASVTTAPADGVRDLDAAGTGCMIVRRRVLEDPRMRLDPEYDVGDGRRGSLELERAVGDPHWAPPVFRTLRKPNGKVFKGEDIDFCERARSLGYTIKAHLGIDVGHYKRVNLSTAVQIAVNAIKREREKGAPCL